MAACCVDERSGTRLAVGSKDNDKSYVRSHLVMQCIRLALDSEYLFLCSADAVGHICGVEVHRFALEFKQRFAFHVLKLCV
jgi:hypothetical protein